jgi:hypothetical protein
MRPLCVITTPRVIASAGPKISFTARVTSAECTPVGQGVVHAPGSCRESARAMSRWVAAVRGAGGGEARDRISTDGEFLRDA